MIGAPSSLEDACRQAQVKEFINSFDSLFAFSFVEFY